MKKYFFAIVLFALVLSGCQAEKEVTTLRIVDGADTGQLVLAGETASAVYTLNVENTKVLLDGKEADISVLEDGMMAEITHNGIVQTSYPAQYGEVYEISVYTLGSANNPGGTCYDICGLYLQVLNDLCYEDAGLNTGAEYISVDLDNAPGDLTDGEKAAIAWIFASEHGAIPLTLSMEELKEEGYLTELVTTGTGIPFTTDRPKAYMWENGVYFCIRDNFGKDAATYSLPVVKFDAWKWRSPLGAYYFSDCSAVWPQIGTWTTYHVEHEMIS